MKFAFLVLGLIAAQPALSAEPLVEDWTGGYAGIQLGQMTNSLEYRGMPLLSGSADNWGFHAGYGHDLGQQVLGIEADLNRFRAANADLLRLKGRAGIDFGRYQPYLVIGLSRLSGDGITETAPVFGVGGDWKVTDRFSVGIEYTFQNFEDVLEDETGYSGYDLKLELVHVRASFRF